VEAPGGYGDKPFPAGPENFREDIKVSQFCFHNPPELSLNFSFRETLLLVNILVPDLLEKRIDDLLQPAVFAGNPLPYRVFPGGPGVRQYLVLLCPVEKLSVLVTDWTIPPKVLEEYRAAGINIIAAPKPEKGV
jgi:hypothetical protein